MRQVIQLSEKFRQYTSLEWEIDWRSLDIREKRDWFQSKEDYYWVLALGSFHPNGYYLEPFLSWYCALTTGWNRCVWLLPGQYQTAWKCVS